MNWTDADRARFHAWIHARRALTVRYGEFDCCTFARDYLREFHGHDDEMAEFAGRYADLAAAQEVIAAGGGLQTLVEARLGPMRGSVALECGAVALGDFGNGEAIGLCSGHNIIAPTMGGLRGFSFARVRGCWLP